MATTQIEFISVNPGSLLKIHDENRKKVRIQVMKDFRRKERERQAAQRHSTSPVPEPTRSVSQIPPQIRSPQLNQTALTQKLRDGWYPVGFGFSTLVPADVRKWSPVLATLDAMKLVHLGSCVRDEQLLVEGRKRFLYAMNCLRGNLSQEPNIALPGLMLVSIGISMTEIYNAIYDASIPTSWQKHIVGMSALMLKQRPIDPSSPLEVFMVARIRGAQLLQSLCTRRPFPVELAAPALSSQSPAIDFVLDMAFRLPPLLSSADAVITRATNEISNRQSLVHDLARIVRDLLALKKMLDSWLKTFCEPVESESALSSRQGQKKRALPDVTAESLCRICLLLIHQAISELHDSHHSDVSSRTRAHEQAGLCAEGLYQTTILLSEIAERPVSKAIATCGPLYFLCNYYRSVSDNLRLERCHEMIKSICAEAPYLNWDMLLPWSFLPLTSVRGAGGPLTAHLTIPTSSETTVDIVSHS